MRSISSLLFVLFHVGRIAIVIYLPTLAITSVSNINPILITAAVGILCIGDMEGVIWSDVIQGILLLGGAHLILIMGINLIDGGFASIVKDASSQGKLLTADNFKFGTASAAIPIIFLGSIFNNLHQYTASQDVVQRYQTTSSIRETE